MRAPKRNRWHAQEPPDCRRWLRGNPGRTGPRTHAAARLDADAHQSGELHHLQPAAAGSGRRVDSSQPCHRSSPADDPLQPRLHGPGNRDRHRRARRALPRRGSRHDALRPADTGVRHEREPRRRQRHGQLRPAAEDPRRCDVPAQSHHRATGTGRAAARSRAPALVDELHRCRRRIQRRGNRRRAGRLPVRQSQVLQAHPLRGSAHLSAPRHRSASA